jgi:prolyl-tRNA synthetase
MRLSEYFLPLLRENPSEAQIVSHRLMLRAGMIRQSSAGIYSWLPFGLRVLKKVEGIVREEQDRAGAQEILMPTIQPAELWRESGRYDDYGKEMLRIRDRHDREMLYGPTNEEQVTEIVRASVKSYRDLPKLLYHIQWKFRDEVRPRFGVMRGREFLMKDAYSFDIDAAGAKRSYNKMFVAYLRTFARMGLKAIPMRADSGPIGGDLSHEFQILAETGESAVYCDRAWLSTDILAAEVDYRGDLEPIFQRCTGLYAATDEMHNPSGCPIPEADLMTARGIEVGHIFYFGDKYSRPMGAVVVGPEGESTALEMGCYGIGVSRLVGALIEANHDEAGIIWPESVAPFRVGLINLRVSDPRCNAAADQLYERLLNAGVEVLYDDRDGSPGAKFATMDLIGLPEQIVIGPRGLAAGTVEVKNRRTDERRDAPIDAVLKRLAATSPDPLSANGRRAAQEIIEPPLSTPSPAVPGRREPQARTGAGAEAKTASARRAAGPRSKGQQ